MPKYIAYLRPAYCAQIILTYFFPENKMRIKQEPLASVTTLLLTDEFKTLE